MVVLARKEMRTVQTAFDMIELSSEAKRWQKTLNELYALYEFYYGYHQEKTLSRAEFEIQLNEIIRQAHEAYKVFHFECFSLSGTYTGVSIRLNLRWFVKNASPNSLLR